MCMLPGLYMLRATTARAFTQRQAAKGIWTTNGRASWNGGSSMTISVCKIYGVYDIGPIPMMSSARVLRAHNTTHTGCRAAPYRAAPPRKARQGQLPTPDVIAHRQGPRAKGSAAATSSKHVSPTYTVEKRAAIPTPTDVLAHVGHVPSGHKKQRAKRSAAGLNRLD